MVQTSQRMTFASGDLTLEGALQLPATTPAPGVVVCHPHPQYGGDMENNVVMAVCQALLQQGYVALRFNFRGTGGSGGAFDQGIGELEDVRAALKHLASLPEVDEGRVGLVGYSFGAMMAAEVAHAGLRALALISPPVGFTDLRVGWGCPALLLGCEGDNIAPAERLRAVADQPDVELKLFAGGDHSWWGREDDLSQALGKFFARHMDGSS